MEEESKRQIDRENQYKNKLNNMNERIYNNAIKLNGYIQNSNPNSPTFKEPFHIKNDYEFNRRVAEIRANDRENQKRDQTLVNLRLKDLEMLREFENKQKFDKLEHQKNYKDFLDSQKNSKETDRIPEDLNINNLIMPSYHYPNKPIPTSKRAADPISWMKSREVTSVSNQGKNCYLGDSALKHNPIVNPLDNIEYNKYLNKQRKNYNHNHYGNLDLKSDQGSTFSKVANSIIA